jgi:uncharacterized repeat protein (TIGR03806 family)
MCSARFALALVSSFVTTCVTVGCSSRIENVSSVDMTPRAGGPPADYLTNPPAKLSSYAILTNKGGQIIPAADVVPYDLNTPLFSDYALKTRMVWVPGGAAQYDATDKFDFPVGTLVAKTFAFAADFRVPTENITVVETRILMRTSAGWVGLPYIWDAAQKDAVLTPAGETTPLDFIDADGNQRMADYLVASETDCHTCHDGSDGKIRLLGPSARQLNKDFTYASGTANELDHWAKLGILDGLPPASQRPKLAVWNDPTTGDVNARARAYLEANCAHCHDATGQAHKSGLMLDSSVTDLMQVGICKPTLTYPQATGGFTYDEVPGDPDHSVMIFRLASTDPTVMMPKLGRSLVHTEGLALIDDWIASLSGSCP